MKDIYERTIDYMRISVTDRCNLRCQYCMPEDLEWIPHDDILSYEEILKICKSAVLLGIQNFKVTGGEPLVRKDILSFLRRLKNLEGVKQVTLTTNGLLLLEAIDELKAIGIDGINISLDTLNKEKFKQITGQDGLEKVLDAIDAAYEAGIKVKVNCVPMKGVNEDELTAFMDMAGGRRIDVRFIEMMPVGYGKRFAGISSDDVFEKMKSVYPKYQDEKERRGNGPARYCRPDGFAGCIGFISAIHGKFCSDCNRVRMTSEGFLKLCLYYNQGIALREVVREGITQQSLTTLMKEAIWKKPLEHRFYEENVAQSEERKMSQIGG